jgi:hypothetical protein
MRENVIIKIPGILKAKNTWDFNFIRKIKSNMTVKRPAGYANAESETSFMMIMEEFICSRRFETLEQLQLELIE